MGRQRRNQRTDGDRGLSSWARNGSSDHRFRPTNSATKVWKPTVPSWEKEYCESVGLPWKELCKAKEYISCYDSVLNWNDSAGEEAFHLAKERYWAKYNGHSCHFPPSDPDIYIDVIDCNAEQLLDVDLPDRADSESENLDSEKLPDRAQETLIPFDIKSHATEIQEKERPFGLGYYVSGSCSYTHICNVVDLYTADPQLPDHYKLTLVTAGWDSGKGLSKEHSTPSRLMCKEENGWENKKATGWNESEMKGTNCPTHIAMLEKNGVAEYTSWVKPIVSGWGLTI